MSVYREGLLGWLRNGNPVAATAVYPEIPIPVISSKNMGQISLKETLLVDIRPHEHFLKGHIQHSRNINLEYLQDQLGQIPTNKTIVLIDHKGKLTLTTGRFLATKGYKQIRRLDGGFNAWVKNGLPVVKQFEQGKLE